MIYAANLVTRHFDNDWDYRQFVNALNSRPNASTYLILTYQMLLYCWYFAILPWEAIPNLKKRLYADKERWAPFFDGSGITVFVHRVTPVAAPEPAATPNTVPESPEPGGSVTLPLAPETAEPGSQATTTSAPPPEPTLAPSQSGQVLTTLPSAKPDEPAASGSSVDEPSAPEPTVPAQTGAEPPTLEQPLLPAASVAPANHPPFGNGD
jgi:hypothetical protein